MKKHKVIGKRLVVAVALAMACGAGVGMADAATKDIALVEGWNLVNTPLEPTDPLLETILVDQPYISAWVWDASKGNWQVRLKNEAVGEVGTYATSKGFATLNKLHAGQGVWLNMSAAVPSLTITGAALTTNTTINPVAKGWNLVGTRSDAVKTVADVATALGAGSKPLSMWKWQNNKWAVALPYKNDGTAMVTEDQQAYATSKGFALLSSLASTEGYWVNASAASGVVTPPDNGSGTTTIAKDNESCMVCHSKDQSFDIADGSNFVSGLGHAAAKAVDQTVSNVAVTSVVGVPQVAFHLATAKGPVTNLAATAIRVYMADLVPAGTATSVGTFSTPYFEMWASERSTTAGIIFDDSDKANGNYSWTFSQPFGTITASSGLNNSDYSANHIQRLAMRVSGTSGVTNNTAEALDYNVTADGLTVTPLTYNARQFVTVKACQKCHSSLMAGTAHGSGYQDTRVCVVCHSPLYGSSTSPAGFMEDDEAMFTIFIHQIHASKYDNANTMPEADGQYLVDQPVTYPQEIKDCVVCHTNSGLTLGLGDEIDNWKNNPTRQVCGSCHDAVDFVTGVGHNGGAQDTDGGCKWCHSAASITTYHAITAATKDVPEYDVTLTLTDPANKAAEEAKTKLPYYVAGEKFTITATLKDHATGAAVDPTVYAQAAAGAKGVDDGLLYVANLYVYGPRSNAVPLVKNIGTNGLLTQPIKLFGKGDSTGFHYEVTVPADATAGTYMVRSIFADYGYVGATDYKIDSIGFTTMQIGANVAATSTVPAYSVVEKKAAGDACINCHGTDNFPGHNARHSAVFDTDHCLSCHDQSGNYATMLAQRIHAVHSASESGDGHDRHWGEITYPQNVRTCVTCHNSGAVLYQTVIDGLSCNGCHADDDATKAHMIQNGLAE